MCHQLSINADGLLCQECTRMQDFASNYMYKLFQGTATPDWWGGEPLSHVPITCPSSTQS